MKHAIEAANLGKCYRSSADRTWTLQEAAVRLFRRRREERRQVWSLRHATFEIPCGRMVGIVGPNGAGKSTLLRLIGGLLEPDEGSVRANGHVGGLLELGAGFHPDLTGRENIFISAVVGGLTRAEVAERFDAIVSFAELARAIDNPLRTYSSGMYLRLAFSVAAHIEPTILLIDEVLAVGDQEFQAKCQERIARFRENGCTILLVSHNLADVRRFCDDAMWLEDGAVVEMGKAADVTARYGTHGETRRRTPRDYPAVFTPGGVELRMDQNRLGSQELSITRCRVTNGRQQDITAVMQGGRFAIEIVWEANAVVEDVLLNICICDPAGRTCFETTAQARGTRFGPADPPRSALVEFADVDLPPGAYFIDVGVYEKDWKYGYDYHWRAYSLEVLDGGGSPRSRGRLAATWSCDCGALVS